MKVLFTFALGLYAAGGLALAQESPQWEVSGGYEYTRVDLGSLPAQQIGVFSQNTGIPSFKLPTDVNGNGFNFGVQENLSSWFGGIFTLSTSYPTLNSNITSQLAASGLLPNAPSTTYVAQSKEQLYTFMAGPQFTLRRSPSVQPFVRVLIGGAHENFKLNVASNGTNLLASAQQANDFGLALGGGGGIDVRMTDRVYFRLAADLVRTALFNDSEKDICVSAGITYRVGSK